MTLVITVLFALAVMVGVQYRALNAKRVALEQQKAEIEMQIEAQKQRQEELVEFKKYTKTKKYAEEVAKDKLGLVYRDEIIFRPEE